MSDVFPFLLNIHFKCSFNFILFVCMSVTNSYVPFTTVFLNKF
ncbi:hypothetical protein Gohar_025483 [Gossypium harknessii]|uniref:Uncharacterized protein n=1 Tax=Gossypium harknessii TaxID=34285 RepID=A0A7J9IA12_9ROSI|nr:hypothetical protein [Gossypium harknessii]